ncbi:MAG: GNAT family N-acetyltransferase [Bacteroidetes bacterium]|nr:GNAT family N-acetyltransferase [Bacteroidota bacterium]
MIKPLSQENVPSLAKLHKEILPSFLSVFPLSFIEGFYKSQLEIRDQLLLGYFEENRLVGFVFGTHDVEKLYQHFISENKAYFYTQTLFSLIKNPKYFLLFASKVFAKPFHSVCKRQLVYIGVDKTAKQKGVGSQLIAALEQEWKGVKYYELEVESNNPAFSFYEKHGFTLVHEYHHWVEKKWLMGKNLP